MPQHFNRQWKRSGGRGDEQAWSSGHGTGHHPDRPARKPPSQSQHKPPATPQEQYRQDRRGAGMRVQLSFIHGLTPNGIFERNAPMRLQCPPLAPFTIQYGHDSQEYETAYTGTYSITAAAKLDVVTFKTLFVEDLAEWVLEQRYEIDQARDILRKLAKSGVPFKLECTHHYGLQPEYSGPMTLTDYTHTEDEPYTYYADVSFKEYRDPLAVSKVHTRRQGGKTWPKHHVLTATDTLYSLARKYYGSASLARLIAEANHIRGLSFNQVIIHLGGKWTLGATINIPAPPEWQASNPKKADKLASQRPNVAVGGK